MDRPAIVPIQFSQDQSDSEEPHAKRQAQLSTWTNRRTRVTQACDWCRERKRQCDYLLPRCGRCQKLNKDCTFLAVQKTRGRPLGSSNNNNKGMPTLSSRATDTRGSRRRSSGSSISMRLEPPLDSSDRQDRQGPSLASTLCAADPARTSSMNRRERRVNTTPASSPASQFSHLSTFSSDSPFSTPTTSSLPPLSSSRASPLSSSITTRLGRAILTSLAPSPSPLESSSSAPTIRAATPEYSKEVIDHLIRIFFEHSFYYFNFFDPVSFLREYDQGVANPCLIDAMCAIAARFSTHPAVIKSPPYLSGEPFAVRVKLAFSRQVIAEVTITYLHAALLLSFYEYSVGRSTQGYHFGGMAFRMAPELQLHRATTRTPQGEEGGEDGRQYSEDEDEHETCDYNYIDNHTVLYSRQGPRLPPLIQQEARMANQVRVRTFCSLMLIDAFTAVTSGLPPTINTSQYQFPESPTGGREWWMRTERRSSASTSMRGLAADLSTPTTTPKPSSYSIHLRPRTTRSFSTTTTPTITNANAGLPSGTNQTSPTPSPAAAAIAPHTSPQAAHPSCHPWPSASSLSPSLSYSYHRNPLSTPPAPSPLMTSSRLRSQSLYSFPTGATGTTAATSASTSTPATSLRNNDRPLLSAFSQSILRVLSHPQLILGREPIEHYCTLIPISAAVTSFANYGCASETILTASSNTTIPSTFHSNAPSNTHATNTDTNITTHTLGIDSAHIRNSSSSRRSNFSNTNDNSPTRGATTIALSSSLNLTDRCDASSLTTPLRSSKRRRANPIFTSREHKIEFERANRDLEQWAEQLPEVYRPTNAVRFFHQLETNSVNLSVVYYQMVMLLHRPIVINASLAANRNQQGVRREGTGGRGRRGGRFVEGTRKATAAEGEAVKMRAVQDQAEDGVYKKTDEDHTADDIDMKTSARIYVTEKVSEDEDELEETRNEVDIETQVDDDNNDNREKDNVRRKLEGRGRRKEKEKTKNDYDSDDTEDLQTIERSTQRCIEAANAIVSIVENFDDAQIKYHGGHHTFTIYLAGTILITQLSTTEEPTVKSQIHERLQVCFRFLSLLNPYWKESDEKAKALRDLLSSHAKQQSDPSDEDDDDEDKNDEDDKDGDVCSDGAEDDDQEGDYSGAEDDGGAEQSWHDLIIADALLDLSNSNRPHRRDYGWRGTPRSSPASSSLSSQAEAPLSYSFSLPPLSPPGSQPPMSRSRRSPPKLRHSRSGSSLSEYRQLYATERQLLLRSLLLPLPSIVAPTKGVLRQNEAPHRHLLLQPSGLPPQTNTPLFSEFATHYSINSTSPTTYKTMSPPATMDPTAPIGLTDRANRKPQDEGRLGTEIGTGLGTGGTRRHTVSTGVSAAFLLKRDKTLLLGALSLHPPPPPPAPTRLHHDHRQTTTWVGGGVYPECNTLEEKTLVSLEKLCLSIKPSFS